MSSHSKVLSLEAQAFYQLDITKIPVIDFTSPNEVAELRRAFTPVWQELCDQIPYDFTTSEVELNGIECFKFMPPNHKMNQTNKVILYLHGGSLIFGHPTLCMNIPAQVARDAEIPVISISYPLAPESDISEQVAHVVKAIKGLSEYLPDCEYGMLAHSAGSLLALLAIIELSRLGADPPRALGLISPAVDLSCAGDTYTTLEQFDPNVVSTEWIYQAAQAFLKGRSRTDPAISPLHADLACLPPTYIQQAGRDKLVSDAVRLNRKLLQSNISSILDIWDGLWHGFQMNPMIPESLEANSQTALFFKRHL